MQRSPHNQPRDHYRQATRRFTRVEILLLALLLTLYSLTLLATAWISDDAYITFRTIDNFNHGYGLTWNVAERVQVYTHPFWMFLLSAISHYTNELYYSTIALSAAISLAAVGLLAFGVARDGRSAIMAVSVLLLSKAFVDFSTSGLENPLTHLLLALFALFAFRSTASLKTLFRLSLVAGLASFNRMDTLLIFLPVLGLTWWRVDRRRGFGVMLLGFSPLVVWELFSLFYYGFLFPNTAYAKLQTGVDKGDLVLQGLSYLLNSVSIDPLTLLALAAATAIALIVRSKGSWLLLAGLLAYVAYVVSVGGDVMSGRFLSPVLFGAALLIAGLGSSGKRVALVWSLLIAVGVTAAGYRTWMGDRITVVDRHGIADERRVYFADLGLLNVDRPPRHALVGTGLELRARDEPLVQVAGVVGMLGYYAGPAAHILDVHGVADPLLARMPALPGWRIGHFVREPRIDYVRSLQAGRNLFVDDRLSLYYDRLFLITRGDLFDRRRIIEIARFNLGQYDYLMREYLAERASRPDPASPARGPVGSSSISGSATSIDSGLPPRTSSTRTVSPSLPRNARRSEITSPTGLPSTSTIRSPTRMPERSAGVPESTLLTSTPLSSGPPRWRRNSGVVSISCTPS